MHMHSQVRDSASAHLPETPRKPFSSLPEIFDAQSVAVVGASSDPGKFGRQVLKTMFTKGFRRDLYAGRNRPPDKAELWVPPCC